jgi:hypothetical protein
MKQETRKENEDNKLRQQFMFISVLATIFTAKLLMNLIFPPYSISNSTINNIIVDVS